MARSASDQARRAWLKQVGIATLATPGGIVGLIGQALAKGNAPVQPGIQSLKGEVRVNGQIAHVGMLVKPGDTISTGSGAEATYVIGRDAFLQRDNSIIEFGAESAKAFMRVLTGKILSVLDKKGPRTVLVSTATIGIRGTGFYIEDEPAAKLGAGTTGQHPPGYAKTYFCLCYGEVELTPAVAPEQRTAYATKHHDHPINIHADPAMVTSMVDAKVINHTDAELTLLEALVGRRPPFWGSSASYQ